MVISIEERWMFSMSLREEEVARRIQSLKTYTADSSRDNTYQLLLVSRSDSDRLNQARPPIVGYQFLGWLDAPILLGGHKQWFSRDKDRTFKSWIS